MKDVVNNLKSKSMLKRAKTIMFPLLVGCIGLFGCTKKSGCEYVEGDYYLTGTFHYFKESIQVPKYPNNNIMVDVNAYLVRDELSGTYLDTMLVTKSSVPYGFRNEGEKHVAVSVVNTITGAITTEARHDFYKLLCIEEIKERN
jgi:hypothetical protein